MLKIYSLHVVIQAVISPHKCTEQLAACHQGNQDLIQLYRLVHKIFSVMYQQKVAKCSCREHCRQLIMNTTLAVSSIAGMPPNYIAQDGRWVACSKRQYLKVQLSLYQTNTCFHCLLSSCSVRDNHNLQKQSFVTLPGYFFNADCNC